MGGNRRSGVALKVGHSNVEIEEFLGSLEFPETEATTLLLPWWDGATARREEYCGPP